ncbi:MAG TPA: diaminopimelate epimerase [Desulfurobacteriaceae bacterium]|nr:diaminopimelate epimerase [Desulfurobacteriaceae bacterium]
MIGIVGEASKNSFVVFKGNSHWLNLDYSQRKNIIKNICNKHNVDGFIVLFPRDEKNFIWDFYNKDGSSAEFCGNGARLAVLTAKKFGLIKSDKGSLWTLAGEVPYEVLKENFVKIQIPKISDIGLLDEKYYYINTGVPHIVIFVEEKNFDDFVDKAMSNLAPKLREKYDANVNFVKILDNETIKVRTYERGVGETLACGSGAVASSIVGHYIKGLKNSIKVIPKAGEEEALFVKIKDKVFLEGKANILKEIEEDIFK